MLKRANLFSISLAIIATMTLCACAVGPDFESPKPPAVNKYTDIPLEKTVSAEISQGGKSQTFHIEQDISAQWWELFQSHELNLLIATGLKNSPNLRSAEATWRAAQEELTATIGATQYPLVGLTVFGGREQFSSLDSLIGSPGFVQSDFPRQDLTLYNANVSAYYVLDVFGGNRRAIEAMRAQMDYERFELEAVYITLTSNIVTTAISEAALRGQIQATKQMIKIEEKQLDLMQKKFKIGGATALDVLAQETLLAETRATLPPLEESLDQTRHALAVLVGGFPGNTPMPKFYLENLHLPTELPLTLPSDLIKQRPDIQAASALLHQASAEIGVATANLLPTFPITASYGPYSDTLTDFFNVNNIAWDWQANMLQTIFNGGALMAQRRAAIDAFQVALGQYEVTVLTGFQNVADSLSAIENDAKALKETAIAEKAAKKTLQLVQKQYQLGGANYLDVIEAEVTFQQTVLARVTAEAARYADTAALFYALGGGWWNKEKGNEKD